LLSKTENKLCIREYAFVKKSKINNKILLIVIAILAQSAAMSAILAVFLWIHLGRDDLDSLPAGQHASSGRVDKTAKEIAIRKVSDNLSFSRN